MHKQIELFFAARVTTEESCLCVDVVLDRPLGRPPDRWDVGKENYCCLADLCTTVNDLVLNSGFLFRHSQLNITNLCFYIQLCMANTAIFFAVHICFISCAEVTGST